VILGILFILSAIPPGPTTSQAATQAATLQGTQAAQTDLCQKYVKAALDATNKGCANTGRNQVCYGNISIKAEAQSGVTDFTFDQPGQIVPITSIQRLQLGVLNPDNQTWGVALFRIQADLPDTAPGQNVTLLAFGDVDIQDAGQAPGPSFNVTTASTVTARTMPSNTGPVLGTLPKNYALIASGRTDDGLWLYVHPPSITTQHGWVLASAVTTTDDINSLMVIDPTKPVYGPMQAFYLRTGVGEATCKGAPPDGILIQSPKQKARVNLSINDVKINVGSTLYLFTQSGADKTSSKLALATLEGSATVASGGRSQTVNVGSQVEVPVDANLKASGPPGPVHPADLNVLRTLPVGNMPVPVNVTASGGQPAANRTPGTTAGGGYLCPSGSPVVVDEVIPGMVNQHVVTGCTCASGTHTINYSQSTPQGMASVTALVCN
jgi:hypothetical protein